ncbi:unnamed protein product, partial [Hapterophycus canaliculatus]
LVVRDSLQDVADWWTKETERFGDSLWMKSPQNGSRKAESAPSQPPKWHVYCVEDSGVGVPPAELSRLGAAYSQLSNGPGKSHAGTGLGLHICKRHVDTMSGALGVASTFSKEADGGGTLFAVVLPLYPANPASKKGGATAAANVEGGTEIAPGAGSGIPSCPDIGSRKIAILVVDDNRVNIKLMSYKIRMYFESSGGDVQVLSATNGRTALDTHAAIRTAPPDGDASVLVGIFVDYFMPELDGIQCTKAMRLLEAERDWPRIPMYGCTADATVQRCGLFVDAGADGVLPKPWNPGDLERFCNNMVMNLFKLEQQETTDGK